MVIAGTTRGTVTNHLGFFEITIDGRIDTSLLASHVGYAKTTIPVPAEDRFKFSMSRVYTALKDIVLAEYPRTHMPDDAAGHARMEAESGLSQRQASATFGRGTEEFSLFIGNELVRAAVSMATDQVVVLFTIDEAGKAINITFPDSTNAFNAYVLKALEKMPPWTPAKQMQTNVQQGFILAIVKSAPDLGSFSNRLGDRIKYPLNARRMGVEGAVVVGFEVAPSGAIMNVRKIRDIGGDCGDEVVNALQATPVGLTLLLPQRNSGKSYLLPVHFGLGQNFYSTKPDGNPGVIVLDVLYVTAHGTEQTRRVLGNVPNPAPAIIIGGGVGYSSLESALAHRKSAERLELVKHGLETFPADILRLPNLKVLDLERNFISSLPEQIADLKKLEEIYLYRNKIQRLPPGFSQLKEMRILGIAENQLSSIPPEITLLSKLEALDLGGNRITEIPGDLAGLRSLKVLVLRDNLISKVSDAVFELKNLTTLDISGNPLDASEMTRVVKKLSNVTVVTQKTQGTPVSPGTDEVFTIVEDPASFPGGMEKFYELVSKEIQYPPSARRAGIEGKVFIEFEIDASGYVPPEHITIVKGVHPALDAEALRVFRSIKTNWIPGTQNGDPVRQRMVVPIIFRL